MELFRRLFKSTFALFAFVAFVMCFSSCIPQKMLVMMQDKDASGNIYEALDSITNKYKLRTNDYLFVNITSPDEKLSRFFNPQSMQGGSSSISANAQFYYYLIDDDMNIDIPVAGKVNLKGCNLEQAKIRIKDAVSQYLNDFTLLVRLATNSFTLLGEFNSQGVKTMARDQVTIYDAVAMGGGFTSYARRKNVKLLRNDESGRAHMYELDLTDDNIINSEFYYVYPNDVLYARPMRVKMLGFGETFSLSLVSSLVTLYLLVLSLGS